MATPEKHALLNLDTFIVREFITIDGQSYDLRNIGEFTIFDLHRLKHLTHRIGQIEKLTETTPNDETEYDEQLNTLVRMVLLAPDPVIAKLTTHQRAAILQAFITLSMPSLGQTRARSKKATTPTTPAIGATTPRVSRGSTAGRRKAG